MGVNILCRFSERLCRPLKRTKGSTCGTSRRGEGQKLLEDYTTLGWGVQGTNHGHDKSVDGKGVFPALCLFECATTVLVVHVAEPRGVGKEGDCGYHTDTIMPGTDIVVLQSPYEPTHVLVRAAYTSTLGDRVSPIHPFMTNATAAVPWALSRDYRRLPLRRS